jgi:hypothetical protein
MIRLHAKASTFPSTAFAPSVFQDRPASSRLLDQSPTPERSVEAFYLQHTRFELIVERKIRRRQLTDDGNVEITGRDLRDKTPPVGQGNLLGAGRITASI